MSYIGGPCWISPIGDIVPVNFMLHGTIANNIMNRQLDTESAIVELCKLGWLHIGTNFVGLQSYSDLTDKQANALYAVMAGALTSDILEELIISYIHS